MHLKRQEVPKTWPIPRKGSVYVVRPNSKLTGGIPILVVLRDMLKIAQNKKEVKRAIHMREILVNGRKITDEKHAVSLFDTITIIPMKKNYVVELSEKKKFGLKEIPESESHKKISKVLNKKILKGKKVQINFTDGNNLISDMKCNVNDSVVVNMKNKKEEKCLPLKERAKVLVFEGKHTGENGVVEKINPDHKMVEINSHGKKINVLIKQIIVTGE